MVVIPFSVNDSTEVSIISVRERSVLVINEIFEGRLSSFEHSHVFDPRADLGIAVSSLFHLAESSGVPAGDECMSMFSVSLE